MEDKTGAYAKISQKNILKNNDEISTTYLNILKDELTKNFAGTNFQPNILKVLYVDNQNLENQLNSINLDNKIDSIFILTDTSIDKIKNLNKNKFYSAPLGFGKNLEKLPKQAADFNEEFMENYEDFSPSWRKEADKMNNRKNNYWK